ncbi:putative allergen asp f4 [Diaporthe ampelina]|uniref:Putative allergen asp f4 n=1 Tax=Diaporthe ampelina TaxID=1214573 RepID=A0A0G2FY55_9PEZI|nr:putative allergen asp f4 [Diaporthe ampelina]
MARLASLLLLGAIGASAHPSGHARFHNKQRSQNEERAIGDTITAVIDGVAVSWVQTEDYGAAATPAIVADKADAVADVKVAAAATTAPSSATPSPTATSSSSAAPKATSGSDSTSTGEGITEFTSFTDLCTAAKAKRATLDQIKYAGNTGSSTNYGCNKVLLANSDLASEYNNTAKFFGGPSDLYCLVWNKIGADGGINGFFGEEATTFKLPAGSEQYVAFDKNSQGGGACFKGSSEDDVEKTSYGAIAGTWAEWDFENDSNNGWSGYDASAIVAQAAGLAVTGMEICAENAPDALCSTIGSGGSSFVNAYRAVDADADGIGGQVSGPMKINIDLSGF